MKKNIFFGLMLLSHMAFAQENWQKIYGSDSVISVGNVFMVDTNHIWGNHGESIYFSPDWGKTWEEQFQHSDYSYSDIFFVDSLTGWSVGWSEVLKTDDGGENWVLQDLPNPMGMDVNAVFFMNRDTGWIAGSYKMIFATYDGGDNWISLHDYQILGHVWLYDIHFIDEMHGCAVGGRLIADESIIMTTLDGGATWKEFIPPGTSDMVRVQYINEFIVWACDHEGMIYSSWDSGITWETINDISYLYPQDMHFFNESEAIITGSSGHTALTSDAWINYHKQELNPYNSISGFSFIEDHSGIGSGYGNSLRTYNGGQNWKRVNDRFIGISFFDPMNGWIVQEHLNKDFMHTNDGGYSWTEVDAGNQGYLLLMDFISDEIGFAITSQGELLKTFNAGLTWELINTPYSDIHFSELQFLDENLGYLCGHPNLVFKTLNGGLDWEEYIVESLAYISGADFISASEGWLADNQGFLAHTTDGCATWETTFLTASTIRDVDFVDESLGYAISAQGIAHRTTNGGETWEDLSIDLNSPEIISFYDHLYGWITDNKNLYETKDGGDTWQEVVNTLSANQYHQPTGFFALDTSMAWLSTMDGRVFSRMNTTGMQDLHEPEDFSLYPNPATTEIQVRSSFFGVRSSVFIYDMFGRKQEKIQIPAGQIQVRIDVSAYPAGIYIAVLGNENGVFGRSNFVIR